MRVRKLKIKHFVKLLSLTFGITWGLLSAPSILAATQDFSPDSPNSLSEANLKSFDNNNPIPDEVIKEEKPEAPTIDLQLYQASVAVKDASEAERYPAFTKILQKVLVKLSGNPNINELASIKPSLKDKNSENLVEQFSYTRSPSFQLNAHFNPAQIDTLLQKAGQPIFNQKRPTILIWLIVRDTEGNSHLVGSLSEDTLGQDWAKTLHDSADTIGLPIIFPFDDVDDLSTISSNNLWELTPKKLLEASERYGATNILVLKMQTEKTSPCETVWALRPEGKSTIHWAEKAKTCQVALNSGIETALHNLFSPPTKKGKPQNNLQTVTPTQIVHLSIFHIQSAEDYQLILNDLQNQSSIVEVEIDKVTPVEVSYVLHVKGNLTDVINTLSTHSELQMLRKNEQNNSIEYEFMGRSSANIWEKQQ